MSEQHVTPERLTEYLHGELPPDQDAAVHAHIGECAACADEYQAEARLTDLLRGHARAQERDLPPGVVASIRAAVAQVPPQPWWAPFGFSLRPAMVAASIAVGLLVGAYFSVTGWRSHAAQAATIDAGYYLGDHDALAPTTPFADGCALPLQLTSDATDSNESGADAAR